MIKHIKVIGLQRSGTTYLEYLLDKNFNVKVYKEGDITICFKHAFPGEKVLKLNNGKTIIWEKTTIGRINEHKDLLVIIIQKHFEHWFESISRKPVDLPVKHPEIFNNDKTVDKTKAFKLYSSFYKAWKNRLLNNSNIQLINYEDIIHDFTLILRLLQILYKLPLKLPSWQNMDKVPQSAKFTEERRKYYLS